MELMNFFRKLTGRKKQPVPGSVQDIVLAAAHIYFMELPHSYFLRKGPK